MSNDRLGLLIDIQTILKLAKFNDDFRDLFYKLSFWDSEHKRIVENYIVNTDVIAKSSIWKELSVSDYIPEINYIIRKWREEHEDYKDIEKQIELTEEGIKGHSLIGKIVRFDDLYKYTELIKYQRKENMTSNGFCILPLSDKSFLQLFY